MELSVEEGSGGDDEGVAVPAVAEGGLDAGDASGVGVGEDGNGLGLVEEEVWLPFADELHALLVEDFVALCAWGFGGGSLGVVEHSELDGGGVGVEGHFASEGVDFADDLSLGDAADGGVAGHLGEVVGVEGEEESGGSESRGGECGLAAGVSGADDDDVGVLVEGGHGDGGRGGGE